LLVKVERLLAKARLKLDRKSPRLPKTKQKKKINVHITTREIRNKKNGKKNTVRNSNSNL